MIALFIWLFHGPWIRFKGAADAEDWPSAGGAPQPHPPNHCRQPTARPARRRHRRQWALLGLTHTPLLRSTPVMERKTCHEHRLQYSRNRKSSALSGTSLIVPKIPRISINNWPKVEDIYKTAPYPRSLNEKLSAGGALLA